MKTLLSISIPLAVSFSMQIATAQSLQFVREEITVNVSGTSCILDAVYYFKNHSPVSSGWPIYYPLIHTDALPFPDSISVTDDSLGTLPFEKSADGVVFLLNIPSERTRKVRIRYHQRTPAEKFEYILTTTKAWGRPLEKAEFHIILPDSLRLTCCFPSSDTQENNDKGVTYHITRFNFLPTSNLVVKWNRSAQ